MREIKFKFVNTHTNKVYNTIEELYSSEDWDFNTIEEVITDIMFGLGYSNIKLIQFTGLKDKNGKEIYEGDILRFGNIKEYREVKYGWYDNDETYEMNTSGYGLYFDNGNKTEIIVPWKNFSCEVIGNIYQNPELLKK